MILNQQGVSVPLVPMNEKAPKSSGPIGRIKTLTNAMVTKVNNGQIKVQKRDGFEPLPVKTRDVTALTVTTNLAPPSPVLSTPFNDSTVQVGNDSTFNELGTDAFVKWPEFVIPNAMRRTPIYANNSRSAIPDGAAVGSLAAYTFRASSPPGGNSGAWLLFKDVSLNSVDQIPGYGGYAEGNALRTKVVSDGTHFWQFFDNANGAANVRQIGVNVYDANGYLLAGQIVDTLVAIGDHWDVTYDSSVGVCLARVHSSFGIVLTVMSIAGSVITATSHDNFTAGTHGSTNDYGIAFLVSHEADGHVYVATINEGDGYELHVVRMNNVGVTEHDYTVFSTGFIYLHTVGVANITGYVLPGTTNINVAWSQMPLGATIRQMDVQTRTGFMDHAATTPTWNDTTVAKIRSVGVASRAFLINGRWVCADYYPSIGLGSFGSANQFGQPTFFLLDIAANQIVGRYEWATAAQDWVTDGWTGSEADGVGSTNASWFNLPSVFTANGLHMPLCYRGTTFVQETVLPTLSGTNLFNQFTSTPIDLFTSTVGVIDEVFGSPGSPVTYAGELLMPGPLPVSFSGEDIGEVNVMLGAEQPTIATSNAGGGLTSSATYQWVLVEEFTSTQGQRVKGAPSVGVSATLGASDNQATVTIPLDRLTNHRGSIWSVYRTWVDTTGTMTTIHRKVTSDLSPVLNSKLGDTIVFTDTVSDSACSVGENLYTDGISPPFGWRYPAPPFTCGDVIGNLVVVAGYDNALWASYEKVEGEALSFSPTRRVPMPTDDPIMSVATLDNRLLIQCQASQWYVDNTWPAADGSGTLPTPIQLPFSNGSLLSSSATQGGVYYASNQGGIWLVDRDLTNTYVGGPVEDDVLNTDILGAVTDQQQRVWFLVSGNLAVVFDTIVNCWYRFVLPTSSARQIGLYQGQVVITDTLKSWVYSPGATEDNGAAIITTIEIAPMAFGGVPGLQMVWSLQFLGETLGHHILTVSLLYDDSSNLVDTYAFDSTLLGIANGNAYRFEVEPSNPECQAVGVKLVDSFPAGPNAGFTLENIGAELGILPGAGKLPYAQRIQPSTPGTS